MIITEGHQWNFQLNTRQINSTNAKPLHVENQMHHSSHHPIYHRLQPKRSQSRTTALYASSIKWPERRNPIVQMLLLSSESIMALKVGNFTPCPRDLLVRLRPNQFLSKLSKGCIRVLQSTLTHPKENIQPNYSTVVILNGFLFSLYFGTW